MSDCTFCDELSTGEPPSALAGDEERLAWLSQQWAILPSLGPVSPLHLLVVPRRHCTFALAAADAVPTIDAVAQAARERFSSDVDVLVFEHANAASGCGVVHAHAHVVTVPRNVEVRGIFGRESSHRLRSLNDIEELRQELSWCKVAGASSAAISVRLPSQTGRRAVAAANGVTFDTDWKAYTHRPWFESSRRAAFELADVLRRSACLARPAA